MKKVVLKVELYDDKIKQKAMQKVSGMSGVESIAVDMKDKKLTVVGDMDPVSIVAKLRKLCHTEIVSVGPPKEPEKKKDESNKKDDSKKGGDEKKQGGGDEKKGGDNKKNDSKSEAVKAYPALVPPLAYQQHYPLPPGYSQHYQQMPYQYHHYPPPTPAYYARGAEEDPNSCVIC